MKFGELAAVLFILGSSIAATGVAPSKTELATMYEKTAQELGAQHYSAALKELDAIDARQPGLAAVQNFRGVVLTQKGDYAGAEAALRAALEIDPKLLPASFNLANVPFLKKDWAQARKRFEALLESLPDEMREEVSPIVQYKILLTYLLENKEEKVGPLLSALQGWTESPAFAYAEAAIAFHRKKRAAGQGWITAAGKDYPAQSNLLFLESFYELDWLPRPAGQPRAIAEFISPAERSARTQVEALANFEAAKRALQARDFDEALKLLDQLKGAAVQPGDVANLRAAILLEQKKFGEAEEALGKVAAANPASWETKYLLAKISLRKKNYAEGRAQLEALLDAPLPGLEHKNVQLIKYRIFLALLLEGKESAAQKTMEEFKFKDDTPALYYAQAAWAFAHDNQKQAKEWVASAGKLFSPALNAGFANALADLGWLGAPPAGAAGAEETAASVTAEATPSLRTASAPPPSPASSSPVAVVAENSISPTPAALPETAEATPSAPSPTLAKSSPVAVVVKSSVTPTPAALPETAEATPSPPPVSAPFPTPAKSPPVAVVVKSAVTPTPAALLETAEATPLPKPASALSPTLAKSSPVAVVVKSAVTPTPAALLETAEATPSPPPVSAPSPTPAKSSPVAVVAKSSITPTPAPSPETAVAVTPAVPASASTPVASVSEKEETTARVTKKSLGKTSRKRHRRAKSSRARSEESPAATSPVQTGAAAPVTSALKPAAAPPPSASPAAKKRPSFLQRLARTLLHRRCGCRRRDRGCGGIPRLNDGDSVQPRGFPTARKNGTTPAGRRGAEN